jgi:hypothetical protein
MCVFPRKIKVRSIRIIFSITYTAKKINLPLPDPPGFLFPENVLSFSEKTRFAINLQDDPETGTSLPGPAGITVGVGRNPIGKNPCGNSGISEHAASPVVPLFPQSLNLRGHNSEKRGTGPE